MRKFSHGFLLVLLFSLGVFSCTRQDQAEGNNSGITNNNAPDIVLVEVSDPAANGREELLPVYEPVAVSRVPSAPISADPGDILSWPVNTWRDRSYEVFSWDRFPEILIFDTADYAVQDRFFKRLAFFVEKDGFRGRLSYDEDIAHLHGWNAHNYRAEDLAVFFQTARETGFPLLPEEWELEYILYLNGIIRWDSRLGIIPGRGAVLSLSRESDRVNTSLRPRFMAHEAFHGIFFVDDEFRDFSYRRWELLPNYARTFILAYFNMQAYDIHDNYLVVNEFMGHILQFTVANASWYFGEHLPNLLLSNSARHRASLPERETLTAQGRRFWPDLAQVFTAEAEAFSSHVNRRWGYSAGRAWR